MRRSIKGAWVLAVLLCVGSGWAQAEDGPQTARQALIEMIFSKTPGTFVKHLPAVTTAALEKSGALANMQQFSMLATQMQTQGKDFQTFETGPVLFSAEDMKTGQKTEVSVVHDTLHGDVDDIVVAFQVYKDGQPQVTGFKPQVTLSMKKEDQVWKLNEISFTVHLPLADPEFLKALTEKMTPQVTTKTSYTPRTEAPSPALGSDAMALGAMRSILTAEVTYAASYPNVGFTCTLSDLDGFGGGQPNEHQAMLISSSLASGKRYGFMFTLSGCSGNPTTAFHLTAAPSGNAFGRKMFCADQSAAIKSSDSGNPAACLASGTPVQ
ncbi:MAG TPA: hypothetical protein VGS78_06120 [Candidatus Sulfotelmatobacter sp.]|nr:hypothetical protein [Candidatus Sulfotelmatobacter sp.]